MKKNPISGLQFRFWTIWCKQCAMVCIFTTLQCTLMAVHIHIILVYSLLTYTYVSEYISLKSQFRVELSLIWNYLSNFRGFFVQKEKFVKWEGHFLDYIQMVNVGCDLMLPLSNSAIYPMHFDPTTRPRSLLPTKFIIFFRFTMMYSLSWCLLAERYGQKYSSLR